MRRDKFTSWAWTSGERLVFLAETEGVTVVGVWKPGDQRIAVMTHPAVGANSGGDSFVPS